MEIQFTATIPIIRIFDVAKAKTFYIDWLGFSIDWEHRFEENFPLYMQVSKGALLLHLTEHHGDATPGANVFIRLKGIDALLSSLQQKEYRYSKPSIENAPWNARVMTVCDPFGNRLSFNEYREDANE